MTEAPAPLETRLAAAGWDPIHARTLARALDDAAPGAIAVFDADGTLWAEDIGEALMLALLDEGRLNGFAAGDRSAWQTYLDMQETDATAAYAWVVELLEGWGEDALVARCEELASTFAPAHAFEPMVELARALEAQGVEVWFVSASNRWVVDAGVRRLGLPGGRVLGMQVAVVDGVLTADTVAPRTNLEGKCDAISALGRGVPLLAAGNSANDAPMLRMAAGASLAVNPTASLYEEARRSGWIIATWEAGASPWKQGTPDLSA